VTPRWRLLVSLALAGFLLTAGCGSTSGKAAAVASTSSSSTTTATSPLTTTGPRLSGGYLASYSNGAFFVQLTMTGARTFQGLSC
jgi:hypothetical protein